MYKYKTRVSAVAKWQMRSGSTKLVEKEKHKLMFAEMKTPII